MRWPSFIGRDEELNRDVAVKVLAARMIDHLRKDNLPREAQTAARAASPKKGRR